MSKDVDDQLFPEAVTTGISPSYFEDEMKESYLNYAYSVITARAIPDVFDGCKPVQRRILFSMAELSLWHDKPTKKSARIIGEVMGKYHPHGDSSIYEAMVKMAQDFSMRYPLVIGQGNFGSIDDDPPAAMRYTEAKLSKIAEFILQDKDKKTVNYKKNFDETLDEPEVLPGKFPNLICNGTAGIAVGMATNIPPHNFDEVAAGIKASIENPEISNQELIKYIPGPDFPTGGIIINQAVMKEIYETGHGTVELIAKIEYDEEKRKRKTVPRLIVSEIPYHVKKTSVIESIVKRLDNPKDRYANILQGIEDIRDESNKEGIRLIIELKDTANPDSVKNVLFKISDLKKNVPVNMTGLLETNKTIDGVTRRRPHAFDLKMLINSYTKHRRAVIQRRTQFDLDKAKKRLEIVEGLLIALDAIDDVIKTIRSSLNTEEARNRLMQNFSLSELQANAILDMKLQKLTSLEINKLREEKESLIKLIAELEEILRSDARKNEIIIEELDEISQVLKKDGRRTQFENSNIDSLDREELINNHPIILTISKHGMLYKEINPKLKTQRRNGKGKKHTSLLNSNIDGSIDSQDYVFKVLQGKEKDNFIFVTNAGKIYTVKGYDIYGVKDKNGTFQTYVGNIERLSSIADNNETITAVMKVSEFVEGRFVCFGTKLGQVAKISLSQFSNVYRNGINAVRLRKNDEVVGAVVTDGSREIVIVKKNSKGFRMSETLFTPHNRNCVGEKATAVTNDKEQMLGILVPKENEKIVFIAKDGRARIVEPSSLQVLINRGGKGSRLCNLGKGGVLADFAIYDESEDTRISVITKNGTRETVDASEMDIYLKKMIKIDDGDEVSSIFADHLEEE